MRLMSLFFQLLLEHLLEFILIIKSFSNLREESYFGS